MGDVSDCLRVDKTKFRRCAMASEREEDAATMAVTNGELHPPSDESPVLSTPGKRKRTSTPDRSENLSPNTAKEDKAELDQTLRYLVQILEK